MPWQKFAEHIVELSFGQNNIAVAELKGKKFCVARFAGSYFAFALKCPHAGAFLEGGHLDALGNLVCPLHRYKYDIKNGRNTSGEGFYLRHWPVEKREDGVYVDLD